jgi:hypothetical protein
MIKYRVIDPAGEYLRMSKTYGTNTIWLGTPYSFLNDDVSGNYSPLIGQYDFETTEAHCWDQSALPFPGKEKDCLPGIYRWLWSGVFAENNIYMSPPSGSTFILYAEPVVPLPVSGAKPPSYFEQLPAKDLKKILPVVLGKLNSSGKPFGPSLIIKNPGEVRRIYVRWEIHYHFYPQAYNTLLAQLLTAKLNIKQAIIRGEPLADAFLMGTDLTAGEVVNQADSLIASIKVNKRSGQEGIILIDPTSDQIQAMKILNGYLELINQGNVYFYHPPNP